MRFCEQSCRLAGKRSRDSEEEESRRLLIGKHFKRRPHPKQLVDNQPDAQPDADTIAEIIIDREHLERVIRGDLYGEPDKGKVVFTHQRGCNMYQARISKGSRREIMQLTEGMFGQDAKQIADVLLCLHMKGVAFF